MVTHSMNTREEPTGLRRRNSACGKRASSPPLPTVPEAPPVPEARALPDPIRFENGSIGFRTKDHFTALNFLFGCAEAAAILALAGVPCGFVFDAVTKHGDDFTAIHTEIMATYGEILDRVEAIYQLPFTVEHATALYSGFYHNGTRSRVESLKDMLAKHNVGSISHNTLVQLALKNFDGRSLLSWKPTMSIPSFSKFCTEMSLVKLTIPDHELEALEALRAGVQSK